MALPTIWELILPNYISIFAIALIVWIIFLILDQILFVGRIANGLALVFGFRNNDLGFKALITTILILLTIGWNIIVEFLQTGIKFFQTDIGLILFWGTISLVVLAILLFGDKVFGKK